MRYFVIAAALLAGPAAAESVGALIQGNLKTRELVLEKLNQAGQQIQTGNMVLMTPVEEAEARVWLHVRNPGQTRIQSRLDRVLSAADASRNVELAWQPVQVVTTGPSRNQIRVFKRSDIKLAEAWQSELSDNGMAFQVQDLTARYQDATWLEPGHIEIWLAP